MQSRVVMESLYIKHCCRITDSASTRAAGFANIYQVGLYQETSSYQMRQELWEL